VERLAVIAETLIAHGRSPDTPAAVIQEGTTSAQRSVIGTLVTIARAADEENLSHPAIVVIGDVVALGDRLNALAANLPPTPA
jgi:uroporphyrin-III C-methyltransferase/precorrin-2 dehydrogenase/sirohydrochlorin ferrochelatase